MEHIADKKKLEIILGKKLIAEKIFGWWVDELSTEEDNPNLYGWHLGEMEFKKWSPQSNRENWPSIWDKMDAHLMREYIEEVLNKKVTLIDIGHVISVHTASPERCFNALVKVLKRKYGYDTAPTAKM